MQVDQVGRMLSALLQGCIKVFTLFADGEQQFLWPHPQQVDGDAVHAKLECEH
jgi:hypothetical protein